MCRRQPCEFTAKRPAILMREKRTLSFPGSDKSALRLLVVQQHNLTNQSHKAPSTLIEHCVVQAAFILIDRARCLNMLPAEKGLGTSAVLIGSREI